MLCWLQKARDTVQLALVRVNFKDALFAPRHAAFAALHPGPLLSWLRPWLAPCSGCNWKPRKFKAVSGPHGERDGTAVVHGRLTPAVAQGGHPPAQNPVKAVESHAAPQSL